MSNNNTPKANNYQLSIGWLYPELMSTYGDRGNVIVLRKRCEWRGIDVKIVNIDPNTTDSELKSINLLFGGGAQDREQSLVIEDLRKKAKIIGQLIEDGTPALFVCGSPQLFGRYYEPAVGKRIEGLGIFDMESVHPGPNKERLIGNVIARCTMPQLENEMIIGFENHGGRTHLGKKAQSFANVIKGYGNNGSDNTEGVYYKNALGSYLHGPLLTKNPRVADLLIENALRIKYGEEIILNKLDDSLEQKARSTIAERLGVKL